MEEQIKSFQKSLNIFITTLIFFVFVIFLPYVTFIGNAVEFHEETNLSPQEKLCNFDIQELSVKRALKHANKGKKNNQLITLDTLKNSNNQDSTREENEIRELENEIESIEKRVESLKLPFIDAIPATTGEIILISPLIIAIYFLFLSFRFNQIDIASNQHKHFKFQTKIISIIVFSLWIYIISMLTYNGIYPNSCQLFNIIRSELIYQQGKGLYNTFYFISLTFAVLAMIIFWAGKSTSDWAYAKFGGRCMNDKKGRK